MMVHDEALEILMGEHQHKKTRKFDGENFRLHEEVGNKIGAEGLAEHMRNRGYLVRIVKEPKHNEWLVYTRRK